jgi:hypothetical protein
LSRLFFRHPTRVWYLQLKLRCSTGDSW